MLKSGSKADLKQYAYMLDASLDSLLSDVQFRCFGLYIIMVVLCANMYILSGNEVQTVQPGVP